MGIHKDTAPTNSLAPDPNKDDEIYEIGASEGSFTDTPDGGAAVKIGPDEAELEDVGESAFYDNLAFDLTQTELDAIGTDLLQKIEYDKKSREARDKLYEEGIKRTGLGKDAPGGAQFIGASKVVHPMLVKASVEYEARVMKELFPPSGPTKDQIPGTATRERVEKAHRKVKFMNWALTVWMQEFRNTLEQVLVQEPLGGVQYMRMIWNSRYRRPSSSFAGVDEVLIPFAATDFYTAERITYVDDITEFEYEERVKSGLYMDQHLAGSGMPPDPTRAQKANDKVEGKSESTYNEDGLRRTYESNTFLRLKKDLLADDGERPYLVYLDHTSGKVMGIVRNWQEKDPLCERMHWLIEWGFIPWRGAYPIGLTHMIGGLSAAATGALRALLDSAHIQNFPGALKLKGASVGGQSQQVQPTQLQEVTGGVGADDIRKLVMPFPNNGPSPTLYQLLGFLVEAGESAVQTAFEKLQDNNNPNMPVGTMMAMIEQGLTVMNSIHARQHAAMAQTLRVLHRIIAMYVTDEEIMDDTGEMIAYLKDFQGPLDVVPVSDPAMFSEAQRFAQMQAVAQRADAHPEIYDQRKVENLILSRMHIQDPDQLLLPKQEVREMNAVNENLALSLGQPVAAYPDQDHLAHIQVLLDFMTSPLLGFSSLFAPKFLGPALDHLKEHIAMWYVSYIYETTSKETGRDMSEFLKIRDHETQKEADRLFATVSSGMRSDKLIEQHFQGIPAIVQQAIQVIQANSPQPPVDPMVEVEQQKVAQRAQEKQQQAQLTDKRIGQDREKTLIQMRDRNQQRVVDIATARQQQQGNDGRTAATVQAQITAENIQQQNENSRKAAELATKERINAADNQTALTISRAEIESGEKVNLSTGRGINP